MNTQIETLAEATSACFRDTEHRFAEMDNEIGELKARIRELEGLVIEYETRLWLS